MFDRAKYDRDGYWIARQVLARPEVDAIAKAFSDLGKNGPVPGLSDTHVPDKRPNDPLQHWPRMMNPHRHPGHLAGELALRYLLDPRIVEQLSALLGEKPIATQSMFYFKPPGARGQALHQDNFYLQVRPGTCMAAWLAIDDSKPDNGGLYVVPKTQSWDVRCPEQADMEDSFVREYIPVPDGYEAVPAILEPGDILFFNGSVVHGSHSNTSSRFRRSLIFHYMPASASEIAHWYRPLLSAQGEFVERASASSGGPCGQVELAPH